MSVHVRQLRCFVAVAEELDFSQAARRLHRSQPPLSPQIEAIEEQLGTPLLECNRRSVRLTDPGRLFLAQARAILVQLGQAGEEVRRAARGEAGEIRIAFTGSVPMFGRCRGSSRPSASDSPASARSSGRRPRARASRSCRRPTARPAFPVSSIDRSRPRPRAAGCCSPGVPATGRRCSAASSRWPADGPLTDVNPSSPACGDDPLPCPAPPGTSRPSSA